jgi:hypothetical protein
MGFNLLAAIATFCLLPVFILLAARAGARGALIVVAVLAAGFMGAHSLGSPVEGVITGKTETLVLALSGLAPAVSHELALSVVLRTSRAAGGIEPLKFEVTERLFDRVREGESIGLHRVKLGPLEWARLDAEPWWDLAPGRLERWLPAPAGSVSAVAKITAVRTVRDAYVIPRFSESAAQAARIRLPQPYDEIRLELVARPGAGISTLDRIDAGSAGSLQPGASVVVQYPPGRPRLARMRTGERTYLWRNRWSYWSGSVIGWAAVAMLLLLANAVKRTMRPRFT